MAAPGRPRPLLVVVGPTAVGKSDFALLAALRLGGEVLSVDSMQIYRGFDRGTAKPGPEALARVPHHGIDLADPRRDFSLGDFVRAAEGIVAGIVRRRRLPVLVGGTGLYLRGLLKGIVAAPPRDEALRARLTDSAGRRGPGHLHRLLRRLDPETARRLPPNDRQRLVRAIEVRLRARRGLDGLIGDRPFGPDRYAAVKIGLTMDRAALYRRVDARVVRFFDAGLVEEVDGLLRSGVPEGANALKALGYREALAHLRGRLTREEAIEAAQRATRRYAKRQWTWFRREEGVRWFAIDAAGTEPFADPLRFAEGALGAAAG